MLNVNVTELLRNQEVMRGVDALHEDEAARASEAPEIPDERLVALFAHVPFRHEHTSGKAKATSGKASQSTRCSSTTNRGGISAIQTFQGTAAVKGTVRITSPP